MTSVQVQTSPSALQPTPDTAEDPLLIQVNSSITLLTADTAKVSPESQTALQSVIDARQAERKAVALSLGKWNTGLPGTSGLSGTPTSQSNGSAANCLSADVDTGRYVTLIRYIQQGASRIKDSPARLDPARKAAGKA